MMKNPRIDTLWTHLHWLTVLAEQGSFTRAAERLDVSKAAMSQKIKEIETLAGVPLVQRTTRSVRLTEAGLRLVEELRQPFAQIKQSFSGICDSGGPLRGTVRVTAPVAFLASNWYRVLPVFYARIRRCGCSLRFLIGWCH